MDTLNDYLSKTESAVTHLYAGISAYRSVIEGLPKAIFVGNAANADEFQRAYDAWAKENRAQIEERDQAFREYFAESFALSTLCGSLLQIAHKAVEIYSTNTIVPEEWKELVGKSDKLPKFLIGAPIRGIPSGLILYAGRNQHIHFEDAPLHKASATILDLVARRFGPESGWPAPVRDPAFDVTYSPMTSLAKNVIALLGWSSQGEFQAGVVHLVRGI